MAETTMPRPMIASRPADKRSRTVAGAKYGILGGLLMALLAMIHTWAQGLGFWLPVKNIAALFLGVTALVGDFGTVLLGLVIHLAVSAGLGALFGAMYRGPGFFGRSVGIGVLFGVGVWAVMTFIVLPIVNQVMFDRVMMYPGWWFFLHLVYGFCVGLAPTTVHRAETLHPRPTTVETPPHHERPSPA